ncbi:MAG TPA: MBL fold metallo-hydrolase [Burkholderiaceae bacterium]|nr:MBL fold metallo-hydrolase [Burkholderiaceae bacterium]
MLLRELNRGKCKTYLVACKLDRVAVLIDPVRDHIDRYLAMLAYLRLTLHAVIDTHTHADHRTGCFELGDLTGAAVLMHRNAPAPRVDRHLADGDTLRLGTLTLRFLATPGHTPDGVSIVVDDTVFTGDTLLIRGTGRADFPGGDAGAQYDSIVGKLFALPDHTVVLPAHDYRGNTASTIGQERRLNPRLAGQTREGYVALMAALQLPLPDRVQEVLQPNQSALDDDALNFPTLAQLSDVRQIPARVLNEMLTRQSPPLVIDVREQSEFDGELGHIAGATAIPLRTLAGRAGELGAAKDGPVVVVCRSGVRSTTAAAILTSLGFEDVSNLKGGMLAWHDLGLPVSRVPSR